MSINTEFEARPMTSNLLFMITSSVKVMIHDAVIIDLKYINRFNEIIYHIF